MSLFQNTACEFPLLRDRFWPESAVHASSANGSHSRRASGEIKAHSHRQPWSASAEQNEDRHDGHGASPGLQSSSSTSTSLDLGFRRRSAAVGAEGSPSPVPKRTASEALPRGRFGLRSLDLQVHPANSSHRMRCCTVFMSACQRF